MSSELHLVRAIDPRVDINSFDRRTYSVFQGGKDVSYNTVLPDGGVSNTQMNYTLNPSSPYVFVDRRLLVQKTFELTFTGVSAGAGIPLLQMAGAFSSTGANVGTQFFDCPRAYPLQNAITNATLIINNDNITQNLNQYARIMPRYFKMDEFNTLTPEYLDQSQEYSTLSGFARDPMRGYGDQPEGSEPRGGFIGIDVISNTQTGVADTAVVRLRVNEYLTLSPLLFEKTAQDCGFFGVQDLQLQLTLGGRGNGVLAGLSASLWSHSTASASVFASVNTTVIASSVLMSTISPDISQQIPEENFYSYYEPRVYPTQTSVAIPSLNTATIQMNNIQLGSIPSRVYLFVSERDQDNDFTKTDTFFAIENVSISFDNRDNLLSNATAIDLFNISRKNGSKISLNQWQRHTGAVLALDFGEDILLSHDQAPGLRGSYNFRATVQCRNLAAGAQVPTLTCLIVSEGVLSIGGNRASRSVGILNVEDVTSPMEEARYQSSGSIYGGNFWSKLVSFGNRVGSFVKKYARPAINIARTAATALAPEFLPEVEIASNVAKSFGLGMRGRGLVGGRRMSRAQLAKSLM